MALNRGHPKTIILAAKIWREQNQRVAPETIEIYNIQMDKM